MDGAPGGWVAVRLGPGVAEAALFTRVADLDDAWGGPGVLTLIDIPIGLPETTSHRRCDAEARRYLGRRASSVFNPPTRSALAARSYAQACDLNEEACGKRLSRQSWGIIPRIAEVDGFLRGRPRGRRRFRECHPETVFQALNGDQSLGHGKRSEEGRRERLSILGRFLPDVERTFSVLRTRLPPSTVASDDLIDALALAIVASRHPESLHTFPADPDRDSTGLPREMVVPRV